MNSTEPSLASAGIQAFLAAELLPLANKLRQQGKVFFPLQPDPEAATYYTRRTRTTMTRSDFEGPGYTSCADLGQALIALWSAQGFEELTVLAATLGELARSLHGLEEQDETVSPFLYVMF